jgi:hypothetical protein
MVVAPRRMGRPGLLGTMARTAVVAGTASAVTGGMSRRAAERDDEQAQNGAAAQEQMAGQPPAQAQPAGPPADDSMARLRQLADMKSQGMLTDDEFAAAKAQVLGL